MRKLAKTTDTATQESNAYVFPNQQRTAKSGTQQFTKKETEEAGVSSSITAFQGLDPVVSKKTNEQAQKITSDDELIDKLYPLLELKRSLRKWYYKSGEVLEPKDPLTGYDGAVKVNYDIVFGVGNDTKGNAETFLKRLTDKNNPLLLSDNDVKDRKDALQLFFESNGGISIVDKLQADAEECMRMYELVAIDQLITDYDTNFYDAITASVDSKITTQEDIDKFIAEKVNMEDFKRVYEVCSEPAIKKFYLNTYAYSVTYITDFDSWIEKLKASKKNNDEGGNGTENPRITDKEKALNIDYKARGKEGDKVDKDNQSFLKDQDLYDKKKKTYPMYNKGVDDDNEVAMNDVTQGSIGDCYLMSSIASVALKNPEYIKGLIDYNEGDSKAIVTLYLKDKTTKIRVAKPITVDFYFPVQVTKKTEIIPAIEGGSTTVTTNEESLPYAKKGDNELWVMLIEKAYAQVMGSYGNIENGNAAEALAVLTGKDSEIKDISSDNETLKNNLKEALKGDHAVVAGTKVSPDESKMINLDDGTPIFYKHAYSVLDVEGDMVKLRNPHGSDTEEEASMKAAADPKVDPKVEIISVSLDNFRKYFTRFYVNSASK